jgi:hypothetical protein
LGREGGRNADVSDEALCFQLLQERQLRRWIAHVVDLEQVDLWDAQSKE